MTASAAPSAGSNLWSGLGRYRTVKTVERTTVCPFELAVTVAVACPRHFVSGVHVQTCEPPASAYCVPFRLRLTAG